MASPEHGKTPANLSPRTVQDRHGGAVHQQPQECYALLLAQAQGVCPVQVSIQAADPLCKACSQKKLCAAASHVLRID